MVKPEELDNAKLKALQSEAARNFAEEKKLEKETKQIDISMRRSFLGINPSSYVKTIIAGIVGGLLVWSFGLDHMLKVNTMNVSLNKKLKSDSENLQKEGELIKKERDDLQIQVIRMSEELSDVKKTSELTEFKANLVEQAHRLEEQSSQFTFAEDLKRPLKTDTNQTEIGWVYLGTYQSKKWIKKNFNFSWNIQPEELVGKMIQPTVQAVNVRTEKFHGDVIRTIRKGKNAKVLKVETYPFTDYRWAKIQK